MQLARSSIDHSSLVLYTRLISRVVVIILSYAAHSLGIIGYHAFKKIVFIRRVSGVLLGTAMRVLGMNGLESTSRSRVGSNVSEALERLLRSLKTHSNKVQRHMVTSQQRDVLITEVV